MPDDPGLAQLLHQITVTEGLDVSISKHRRKGTAQPWRVRLYSYPGGIVETTADQLGDALVQGLELTTLLRKGIAQVSELKLEDLDL